MSDTNIEATVLSVGQQRRVVALNMANLVLRTSGFFQSNQPKDAEELIKLAEWVMNGTNDDPAEDETRNPLADVFASHNPFGPEIGVIELKGDELTGFLDFLANVGCGDPDCAVHGEKVQADEAGDDGEYPINERGDEPAEGGGFPTTEGTEHEDRRPDDTEAGDAVIPPLETSTDWAKAPRAANPFPSPEQVAEAQSPAVNDHDERPTFN